ncbi:MAG: hypothetical protein HQL49_12185 [Gammaproteobacteria bacterium]|nr:hypothetical protein [Gammaproteobacteria bacterium]
MVVSLPVQAAKVALDATHWGIKAGEGCVSCHQTASSGLHQQWQQSAHAKAGVNCLDCHQAKAADSDAFTHEGEVIATLVTPQDCGRCHAEEYAENSGSIHSQSRLLLLNRTGASEAELDAAGCSVCHGSRVTLKIDGTLATGWPNSGVGRLNPDGSRGACSACHGRHQFSRAEARDPQSCRRCHQGSESPDHEAYQSSRHGILFAAHRSEMNLQNDSWVVGKDYSATATCVTCHMGAAPGINATHDVGMRDIWNLGGVVSEQQSLVIFENGETRDLPLSQPAVRKGDTLARNSGESGVVKAVAAPARRRAAMSKVCLECHGKSFATAFFTQFDAQIERYNLEFAIPAQALMQQLYDDARLTPTPFDEPLELSWWRLWHDLGISYRHGAAMASPSMSSSEGWQKLQQHFYGDFLPQLQQLLGVEPSRQLLKQYWGDRYPAWLTDAAAAAPLMGYESLRPAAIAPVASDAPQITPSPSAGAVGTP